MVPEAGTSVRNPIDAAMVSSTVEELDRTMRAIFADPVTDLVILNLQTRGMTPTRELTVQEITDWLVSTSHEVTKGKPIVIVLNSIVLDTRAVEQVNAVRRKLLDGGVPVFPTLRSAARALSRHISYYEFQEQIAGENAPSVSG
jgi:acyl-CoA synthetase (NDP forming)